MDSNHSLTIEEVEKYFESKICECCNKPYQPGELNFYNLCDPCFINFDNQKMMGRFGQNNEFYTEDSNKYVQSGRCNHKFNPHFMSKLKELIMVQNL